MTLKINKVKYSSRGGITVELERPGTVTLTAEEAAYILMDLKATLTQSELDENFEPEEQAIIVRYVDLYFEKMEKIGTDYLQKMGPRRLAAELKAQLALWIYWSSQGTQQLLGNLLGWKIVDKESSEVPERDIDFLIKMGIEDNYERLYFERLLKTKSLGEPSAEIMEQLEVRYGPFNLDFI